MVSLVLVSTDTLAHADQPLSRQWKEHLLLTTIQEVQEDLARRLDPLRPSDVLTEMPSVHDLNYPLDNWQFSDYTVLKRLS